MVILLCVGAGNLSISQVNIIAIVKVTWLLKSH